MSNLLYARVAYRMRRAQILRQIRETRREHSAAWCAALRDYQFALITARKTRAQAEADANRSAA